MQDAQEMARELEKKSRSKGDAGGRQEELMILERHDHRSCPYQFTRLRSSLIG
jgi:hypothetical protein